MCCCDRFLRIKALFFKLQPCSVKQTGKEFQNVYENIAQSSKVVGFCANRKNKMNEDDKRRCPYTKIDLSIAH